MDIPSQDISNKIESLNKWFKQQKGSIVAFSGGIDSTLVLYMARQIQGRENVIGVISNSESLKEKDFKLAQDFCKQYDIILEVVNTREIEDERYNQNPEDRCFYCKEHLYVSLQKTQEKYPDFIVLNGTNFDDYDDYRPGLRAANKYKVYSPMADCKLIKADIRTIARHYELPNWDKPASPCLSSRIPYNHSITSEKLKQVENAEDILNRFGFNDVRVRHFGNYGKIEVQKEELEQLLLVKDEVVKEITALGFERCDIDDEGLVSGKLNRAIGK